MKTVMLIFSVLLLLLLAGNAWGQLDTLYAEFFTDGTASLSWFTGWEGGNNMEVDYWEGNPSGDNWVGFVGNDLSGGGVGTALAGDLNLTDYEYEAQVYTRVGTGEYNGIVARWDSTGGLPAFYGFRADFDSDQRLQLRKFTGASPITIAEWVGAQIPGGVPTQDSWHLMGIKFEGNQIWVYWDGVELSGSPFTDDHSSRGFFGIYCFWFMGSTETYCDDIVVLGEAGPQPFDFIAQENTILDDGFQPMILRPAENQTVYFRLNWDAVNGITTSPAFDVTLEMDDVEIFRTTNPGVEPNTSHETTSSAWVAALGEHTLRWTVDADDAVPEGNEDNNVLEETFLVLPETAYDFQADSSWVANSDTIPYPGNVPTGDEVLFVLHWSVPMGSGPSGAFNISMDLDGANYYTTTFPGAVSGQNYMTVTSPWTAEEGLHYYEWTIDPDNWVDEFNEYNNWIMDAFTVETVGVRWDPVTTGSQPEDLRISSVYPNPFNPSVTLRYENVELGYLKLAVYDVSGRQVAVLREGFHPAGVWEITWSAENLAAGTYFAVLEGGGQRSVQPLLLVK